ncbi:hypothetical protein Poly21_07040 [Allorhodopirellula heiligendammensis]|uniref:Uncharacterized protein n=1 Tax=Allorhodopirellula heiligendammensis TaxID=2714739 RepID=A0A5C6C1V6_9BACT|nr:hypothetical protein Poly21_07040 [Allorhodopirellula heiligendammensis]
MLLHADMRIVARRSGSRQQNQTGGQPDVLMSHTNQLPTDPLALVSGINRQVRQITVADILTMLGPSR